MTKRMIECKLLYLECLTLIPLIFMLRINIDMFPKKKRGYLFYFIIRSKEYG